MAPRVTSEGSTNRDTDPPTDHKVGFCIGTVASTRGSVGEPLADKGQNDGDSGVCERLGMFFVGIAPEHSLSHEGSGRFKSRSRLICALVGLGQIRSHGPEHHSDDRGTDRVGQVCINVAGGSSRADNGPAGFQHHRGYAKQVMAGVLGEVAVGLPAVHHEVRVASRGSR
jgi:hypothetical protein